MMRRLVDFLCGLGFGLALILAGMTDPGKVIGFLDLAGAWDPSLALVMGGAVAVGLFGFALAYRRGSAVLGGPLEKPAERGVDARLVAGSLLFGIGWGITGFCPGPALVALGAGHLQAVLFVVAMLAGMALVGLLRRGGSRASL